MARSGDSSAAVRTIVTAMSKGTKKMKANKFFWSLQKELKRYKRANHDQFVAFLREAGIAKAPTPDQCDAAAKLARQKRNAILAPYAPIERGY